MKCELRKHLRPAFGSLSVEEITPQLVSEWAVKWCRPGLSVKSVKNLVITLNLIRKHAGLSYFPAKSVTYPSQSEAEKEQPCHMQDHAVAIVAAAKGWHKVYLATAAGTGLRAGELAGLRIETGDVDLGKKRSMYGEASLRAKSSRRRVATPIGGFRLMVNSSRC
jgi:integrase